MFSPACPIFGAERHSKSSFTTVGAVLPPPAVALYNKRHLSFSEYLFEDAAQFGDRILGKGLAPPTDVLIGPHQNDAAIPHLARACPVARKILPSLPRPDNVSFDIYVELRA